MSTATGLGARLDDQLGGIVASNGAPAGVLAAITGERSAVVYHGDPRPDAHSTFEIGSLTKTFTALLLAEMAERGDVGYQDPISNYLPAHAKPTDAEAAVRITLESLATHTAGLPHLPTNLELFMDDPAWLLNPYADYRLDDPYEATAQLDLTKAPGGQVEYPTSGSACSGGCWPTQPTGTTATWSRTVSASRLA